MEKRMKTLRLLTTETTGKIRESRGKMIRRGTTEGWRKDENIKIVNHRDHGDHRENQGAGRKRERQSERERGGREGVGGEREGGS
jgi:hypothetical protein